MITPSPIDIFEDLIAAAPDGDIEENCLEAVIAPRNIEYATGIPKRYREEWDRPDDPEWQTYHNKVVTRVKKGGIIALIGNRGTGKTRLAAETARDYARTKTRYTTAMALFLRIRATYNATKRETESDIVFELTNCRLLILDEIQERGDTAWEDRMLTHIIDKRYGAMLPTIIIANLKPDEMAKALGDSVVSRISETGGTLSITGKSHRESA